MEKKITGDEPAFAAVAYDVMGGGFCQNGLSKREYFAALIMANCYERWGSGHEQKAAGDSVCAADALIAELNK